MEKLLQFFKYEHLPTEDLRNSSKPFCDAEIVGSKRLRRTLQNVGITMKNSDFYEYRILFKILELSFFKKFDKEYFFFNKNDGDYLFRRFNIRIFSGKSRILRYDGVMVRWQDFYIDIRDNLTEKSLHLKFSKKNILLMRRFINRCLKIDASL